MPRSMTPVLFCMLALCAGAAQAKDYACSFTTECVGLDTCQETTFSLTFFQDAGDMLMGLNMRPPAMTPVQTEFADFVGASPTNMPLDMIQWTATENSGDQHLFTLYDGIARYSIHMPTSGLAIYYEGTCTEATP